MVEDDVLNDTAVFIKSVASKKHHMIYEMVEVNFCNNERNIYKQKRNVQMQGGRIPLSGK